MEEIAHSEDQKQQGGEVVVFKGGAPHQHPGRQLGQISHQQEGGPTVIAAGEMPEEDGAQSQIEQQTKG
jgi:hypothetical protein